MGNQLTAVASVNLADVSSQYEYLSTLGDPGRSYATSFHCLDRQAVEPTQSQRHSPSPQALEQADARLEDSAVALTRQVRLNTHRRRRQATAFVRHVCRQYARTSTETTSRSEWLSEHSTVGGRALGDDSSRVLMTPPSPPPASDISGATEPTLLGAFADHDQQYRELFLYRSGDVANAAWPRSYTAPELHLLQRPDVPSAVRQRVRHARLDLNRLDTMTAAGYASGVYAGAGPGGGSVEPLTLLPGRLGTSTPASTSTLTVDAWSAGRCPPQDVVVKVFVTTEGNSEQQKQLIVVRDMMRSVGEQLNAIDATRFAQPGDTTEEPSRTETHRDERETKDSPTTSTSAAPTRLASLHALLPGAGRSHSVLYYTRIRYPDGGRFSLLQRPFIAFSLPERLQMRPYWGATERLFACYQLLRALQELHDTYGVVHGDVKPNNVLVQTSGWLYVTDLALYKPAHIPSNDPAMFAYYYDTEDTRACYLAPEKFVDVKGWGADGGVADTATNESNRATHTTTATSTRTPASVSPGTGLFPDTGDEDVSDMTGVRGSSMGLPWSAGGANVHAHTVAMDVFSAGCVMAYILTGEHVLHLAETLTLRGLATESARLTFVQSVLIDKGLTDMDLVQLLCRVLCSAPSERPTARQLLEAFTPRVFPVWFADLYETVLPALLSQPADVQLEWLQSTALPHTVTWCAQQQTAATWTVSDADVRSRTAEHVSHFLLPVLLGAVQTAATNDATLRGLTCLKRWFVSRVRVATLLDSVLPFALTVTNSVTEYPSTTRLMALRVLMAIGLRVLRQNAPCADTRQGSADAESDEGDPSASARCGSNREDRTAPASPAYTPHDAPLPFSMTCEALFCNLLFPCFTELVRLASVEQEILLLELAHQLPSLLLLCRYSLTLPSHIPTSSVHDTEGRDTHSMSHQHGRHGADDGVGAARSSRHTLQALLGSGWELLQSLYKHSTHSSSAFFSSGSPSTSTSVGSGVVAALLEETPTVVAFLGDDRVHRDLLPLLTTLIASPPPVRRQLYPQSVYLHALLESPRAETLQFFVTEGLRQTDVACLVQVMSAMVAVLSARRDVLAAADVMPSVHQAVPLLLSASPLVFRAATVVVATAARLYRPSEVAMYLEDAVRPLLTREALPLDMLDGAPRSVIRADVRPPEPAALSLRPLPSSSSGPSAWVDGAMGTVPEAARHRGHSTAPSADAQQPLSEEERFLLLEHVQLRRTLNDTHESLELTHTNPTLFAPLDPSAVARVRTRASAGAGGHYLTDSRHTSASEESFAKAMFEEVCPAVLLVPPTAAPRTCRTHAALLTSVRPFLEMAARSTTATSQKQSRVAVKEAEDPDTAISHGVTCQVSTPTEAHEDVSVRHALSRQESRRQCMQRPTCRCGTGKLTDGGGDGGHVLMSRAVCACPSRPLRPLSVALASASVHMGAVYTVTALDARPSGDHVLLSAGAREEALMWDLSVDSEGICGQMEVRCRIPHLASTFSASGAQTSDRRGAPTYLAAQRMEATTGSGAGGGDGSRACGTCTSVLLGGSDGVVRYYDAHREQYSGYCSITALTNGDVRDEEATNRTYASAMAAVTALDVHSSHTFFAGTSSGVVALVDTRMPTSSSAALSSTASSALAWMTRLDAAEGAISCLSALHFGHSAYAVVAATYGGFASLFDLRYNCRVATYDVTAGMSSDTARPSLLSCCPDPCTFAHALCARFGHPGPALLFGASDGQAYRLQLRTGELSLALQVPSEPSGRRPSSQAVRALLCQPHFGCVVTGSEDGVLRQWQLPPCGAPASVSTGSTPSSSPPTHAAHGDAMARHSGAIACPPVLPATTCERFHAPRTLVSSTPAYLLDESPSLWPEAAWLSGLLREGGADLDNSDKTMVGLGRSRGPRHRAPDGATALFPTVSLREQERSDGDGLPPLRHHKDAVLALAALWSAPTAPTKGSVYASDSAGPYLVSGSRDGTISVWQNASPDA